MSLKWSHQLILGSPAKTLPGAGQIWEMLVIPTVPCAVEPFQVFVRAGGCCEGECYAGAIKKELTPLMKTQFS